MALSKAALLLITFGTKSMAVFDSLFDYLGTQHGLTSILCALLFVASCIIYKPWPAARKVPKTYDRHVKQPGLPKRFYAVPQGDIVTTELGTRTETVPLELPARLKIVLGEKVYYHYEIVNVRWRDDIIKSFARSAQAYIVEDLKRRFYQKSFDYVLFRANPHSSSASGNNGDEHEMAHQKVDQDQDEIFHKKLQADVAKCLGTHQDSSFYLEITIRFGELPPVRDTNMSLADDVREILDNQSVQTIKQMKRFVPAKFLRVYLSREMITRLLEEHIERQDSTCTFSASEISPEFIEWVYLDGVRLLAACLSSKLCLKTLYNCYVQKIDDHITLSREFAYVQCHGHEVKIGDILREHYRFKAHVFPRPNPQPASVEIPKYEVIPDDVVVPITSADPEKPRGDKAGRGSFGEVYKVFIHEDYHGFATDNRPWALKIIRKGNGGSEHFNAEADVLRKLAKHQNEHILPLITAWSQRDKLYLLFPLADCNLREFLAKDSPDPFESKISWMIGQMLGLSSALYLIHDVPGDKILPHVLQRKKKKEKSRKQTGFHHDLKPENILVFGQQLKIGDFGTARIHQVVSGQENKASHHEANLVHQGGHKYAPPDYDKNGSTSRPYDIWSLGCIFLEVLICVFDGREKINQFRQELKNSSEDENCELECFWWKRGLTYKRKKVVDDEISKFRNLFTTQPVFLDLIDLIDNMLDVEIFKRKTATEVWLKLRRIGQEAEDLRLWDKESLINGSSETADRMWNEATTFYDTTDPSLSPRLRSRSASPISTPRTPVSTDNLVVEAGSINEGPDKNALLRSPTFLRQKRRPSIVARDPHGKESTLYPSPDQLHPDDPMEQDLGRLMSTRFMPDIASADCRRHHTFPLDLVQERNQWSTENLLAIAQAPRASTHRAWSA